MPAFPQCDLEVKSLTPRPTQLVQLPLGNSNGRRTVHKSANPVVKQLQEFQKVTGVRRVRHELPDALKAAEAGAVDSKPAGKRARRGAAEDTKPGLIKATRGTRLADAATGAAGSKRTTKKK